MTQVSLYGDFPVDLDLDLNQSDSDHEDESQKEEIKKALQAFGEESFDLSDYGDEDDDDLSQNESRSSSVNQSRIKENHENTGNSVLSDRGKDTSNHSNMNGRGGGVLIGALMNGHGGSLSSSGSLSPGSPFMNGVNLNMLPNTVVDAGNSSETRSYAAGKVNGHAGSHVSPPVVVNGHGHKLNGSLLNGHGNGNNTSSGSGGGSILMKNSQPRNNTKKQVTIVEESETIRDQEEILEGNPTISLHHQGHCPRMEKDGFVNDDMWLSAERSDEQLKTMLQIRERQIQQGEQEIAKLQKDKRALNHQIGLMKTETVQMRSKQDEFETYKKVKEQEIEFMKSKMRDTIAEFEKVKENEIAAAEYIKVLTDEIEKYKQEVQLLSSIGSSVQQVEINDVVRQLREKHESELISWRKQVLELQGQLRTYKRKQQQLPSEESPDKSKADSKEISCQTDEVRFESPSPHNQDQVRRKEMTQFAILKNNNNEDDVLIKEKKIISLNEKFEELKREFQEERDQKEMEIREYRERLARLPTELYQRWEETQRELGLKAALESRPICVDAFTSMEPDELEPPQETNEEEVNALKIPNFFVETNDAEVQVDLIPSSVEETGSSSSNPPESTKLTFSAQVQTDDENSSLREVNTQTDETLETFNELGILIASWHKELVEAKENEEELKEKCREYEMRSQELESALTKYHKQFKVLQKVATKCRKESKKREEIYKKEISDLKQHQREVLEKLTEKLNILS